MQQHFAHLFATPKAITLAGITLAQRNLDGTFAVAGREKQIHAQLQAAYGKPVSPQAIGYIRRGCELLSQASDEELENAAYPFHPHPHAKLTAGNEFSDLTKGLMMFALTGLGDMENVPEGKARLLKMQTATHGDALLKSYGLPTWEEVLKYSPDEPRIPAGQTGGGQWTAGDGTTTDSASTSVDDVRTAPDKAPSSTREYQLAASGQIMTDANGVDNTDSSKSRQVNYSDGTPVIDPNTGKPYPMPDGMDIAANVKAAENYDPDATDADKASSMIYWFSHGGPQDYQRPDGYIPALFGDFVLNYRNVTNYNYGAVAAAMGYSLDEALTAAGIFNQMVGNPNMPGMNVTYGIQNKAVNNITQGFQDYWDGKWTTKKK